MRGKDGRASWFSSFAPENDDYGISGVLTTMSADPVALEGLLEAFTGQGAGARRRDGRIALTLFADRLQPEMRPLPGLYQPFCRDAAWSPGQCQHAKIGLLLFGGSRFGAASSLRLIVSTGNWTTFTVSGSIDLLWSCSLYARSRHVEALPQEAADVLAAADFLDSLRGRYLLPGPAEASVVHVVTEARRLAVEHLGSRSPHPRFIATVGAQAEAALGTRGAWAQGSLGTQVHTRFKRGSGHRNLLFCGSGFFEQGTESTAQPTVLNVLVRSLQEAGSLSKSLDSSSTLLVANPGRAGAAAPWIRQGMAREDGWTIRTPRHPLSDSAEQFHAKFILLANRRERITGGQLYLGSGNLSIQGFLRGCGGPDVRIHGNVEAGVVLEVPSCSEEELLRSLGVDPEMEMDPSAFPAISSDEEEDVAGLEPRSIPPIVAAIWYPVDRRLSLVRNHDDARPCHLRVDSTAMSIDVQMTAVTLPPSCAVPTRIEVVGDDGTTWSVPVFSADGGFCRGPAERFGLDEILNRILDFPGGDHCDDDDETADGDPATPIGEGEPDSPALAKRTSFALHRTMSLIEAIAERNQTVTAVQFPDWVTTLKRLLLEDLDDDAASAIQSLRVNVIAPLLAVPGFAPPFSDRRYCEVIQAFIARLGLDGCPDLVPMTSPVGQP